MADQVQQESTEPPSDSDEGDEGDAKMDPALWAFTSGLASLFSGEVDSTSLKRHYAAFVSSRVASGSDKACARAETMSIAKEFAEFKKTL